MARDVYADIGMPSTPFLRLDRFAALVNGKIYVGVKDTDPLNPANQTQVFVEDEDGTLTPIPQPVRTNVSGYPVWNGQVVKLITKIESSMKVMDANDVQQFYFGNLFKYDPVQMWNLLTSPTGWEYVGTNYGVLKESIQGWITPFQFVGKAPFTSVSAAIQTMFDTAQAQKLAVWAIGWEGTLDGNVTATDILIMGGTWKGTPDFFMDNSTLKGATIKNARIRVWGGDVRIRDCLFDGKPTTSKVASVMMQALPKNATVEVTESEFRNGLYGILQQGTGELVTRGLYRNLSFYDMGGDGIELNVVQRHYDDGCVIENIYLENIDSTGQAPINPSNWGIGIGVAGQSPYGIDTPDENFAKNITIRNVTGVGVRQLVHFEMVRDSVIENINGDPDQNVSNGSGLTLATVLCYGSRRVSIDGVRGEPIVQSGTLASDVRVVMLEWGTNAGVGARGPCQDMTVRNVYSKTGRFYAGVGTEKAGATNRCRFSNINVAKFSVFGVATELDLNDISGDIFDAIGDDSSGGTPSNGYIAGGRTVLRMNNVNFGAYPDQGWSRCAYSQIDCVNSNVFARPYPRSGTNGGVGAEMQPSNHTYLIPTPDQMDGVGIWDGNAFPTGREFMEGDLLVRNDGKIFAVETSGAYLPAVAELQIKATAAGQTYLAQNYAMAGNKSDQVWFYKTPLTQGTRITIPGAGAGGAPLNTVITRAPYSTNPSNPTAEIRIDIADAIVTGTVAGVQLAATKPISFRTPV